MNSILSFTSIFLVAFLIGCATPVPESTSNNDPNLVGKWIRKKKYHLDLHSNGIGSKEKGVVVTEDIKKFKKERINWVTFNNNFLLINTDEEVIGFSYQVSGDTLFLRQPEDNLEFFLRGGEEVME